MRENGETPDVSRPLVMESGVSLAGKATGQRLQEVTVPRYSARIFDGNLPTIGRSRYIWAPTEGEAARQAQEWLRVVRATQSRMRSLDTWTISSRLSPHRAPEVILSGTIPAVT